MGVRARASRNAGGVDHTLPTNPRGFVLARDVRAAGRLAELRAAVRRGELERRRAGVYRVPLVPDPAASRSELAALRYQTTVLAAAETLGSPVFTGASAAVLAGLPIIGDWPSAVWVLSRDAHGHARAGVTSIARPRSVDVGVVHRDGLATTEIEFTLIQVCRALPLVSALAAVDAALFDRRPRRASAPAPLTTLDRLRDLHARLLPYPRSVRVGAVLARATASAETPLETLSRVSIEELGFPEPELQHELWLPELGRHAVLDFHWPAYGIGAEADGREKYVGGSVQAGLEAVHREKQREDAVRHRLAGFARWEWDHAWHRTVLGRRLTRAGLPMTRRPIVLR